MPSSDTWFHSLQATSHALQPMHSVESVRKAVMLICCSLRSQTAGGSRPLEIRIAMQSGRLGSLRGLAGARSLSRGLLQIFLPTLQCRFAFAVPPRRNIANRRFGFHDAHVG